MAKRFRGPAAPARVHIALRRTCSESLGVNRNVSLAASCWPRQAWRGEQCKISMQLRGPHCWSACYDRGSIAPPPRNLSWNLAVAQVLAADHLVPLRRGARGQKEHAVRRARGARRASRDRRRRLEIAIHGSDMVTPRPLCAGRPPRIAHRCAPRGRTPASLRRRGRPASAPIVGAVGGARLGKGYQNSAAPCHSGAGGTDFRSTPSSVRPIPAEFSAIHPSDLGPTSPLLRVPMP